MRALSPTGIWIDFILSDGMCPVNNELFILPKRPGTPFLRYDTILRGMDIPNLFEGDILLSNEKQYVICYKSGFYALPIKRDSPCILLSELTNYKRISNIYKRPDVLIDRPSKLNLKYHDTIFTYAEIFDVVNNNFHVNAYNGMLIPINATQQDARITYEGRHLYFGDFVEDGEVVLRKGVCALRKNMRYYSIKTKGEIT